MFVWLCILVWSRLVSSCSFTGYMLAVACVALFVPAFTTSHNIRLLAFFVFEVRSSAPSLAFAPRHRLSAPQRCYIPVVGWDVPESIPILLEHMRVVSGCW